MRVESEFIMDERGNKWWFTVGSRVVYHRTEIDPTTGLSLPAIEHDNGDKWWYVNGTLHREDGPAFESGDGKWARYYINGKPILQLLLDQRIYGKENLAKYLVLL